VGSSLVNRLRALLKLAVESRDLGMMARDITGSGTVIGSIEYLHKYVRGLESPVVDSRVGGGSEGYELKQQHSSY